MKGLFAKVAAGAALASLAVTQVAAQSAFEPVTDAMIQNPDPKDWLSWRLRMPGIVGLEDAAKARRLVAVAGAALEHRAEARGGFLRHDVQPSAISRASAAGSLSMG